MTWFSGRRARSVATTPHRDPPERSRPMRLKPLLAVAVTAVTVCSAAPSAHAGWMTGRGSLPGVRSDVVCSDGMDFELATYVSSVPREPLDVPTIRFPPCSDLLACATAHHPREPRRLGRHAGRRSRSVARGRSRRPTPSRSRRCTSIRPRSAAHRHLAGRAGRASRTAVALRLDFNRWLAPGTQVRVGWGNWNPDTPNSTRGASPSSACRGLGVVHEPGEPVFSRSGRE